MENVAAIIRNKSSIFRKDRQTLEKQLIKLNSTKFRKAHDTRSVGTK